MGVGEVEHMKRYETIFTAVVLEGIVCVNLLSTSNVKGKSEVRTREKESRERNRERDTTARKRFPSLASSIRFLCLFQVQQMRGHFWQYQHCRYDIPPGIPGM